MIRFSTSAAGAVTMLDTSARDLLRMSGRPNAGARGGIAADELHGVIATLRGAIAAATPPADGAVTTGAASEDETQREAVSLHQRAYPLLDLLERAAKKNASVLWEHL